MAATLLASFPNSRIKPRAATSEAQVNQFTIPDSTATAVLAPNLNRTYGSIKNESALETCWYGYTDTLTDTFKSQSIPPLGSVEIDTPTQSVYIYQTSGTDLVVSVDEGQG